MARFSFSARSLAVGALAFAGIGTAIVLFGYAANTGTGREAESGSRSAAVSVVSDAGASGGQAVKFGAASGSERVITTAYTTAYTWYDNTPPGSAIISNPIIHSTASGTGTYQDPITVAVGHDLSSGHDVLDFAAGTIMYFADLRRYFIVEDTCGDGPTPQNGPCHQGVNADGSGSTIWLDVWIGGQSGSESAVQACAGKVTDGNGQLHTVVINPRSNYAVASGNGVFHDGLCDANYGNQLVTQ